MARVDYVEATRLRSALVFIAVLTTACSASARATGSTTTSRGVTSSTISTSTAPAAVISHTPTTIQPPARVGATVSIPSSNGSAAEQITLVKVLDPATSADQFSTPVAGGRLVGLVFRISTGVGGQTLEDPTGDALIEDSQDTLYVARPSNVTGCPSFPASLTTDSSGSLNGCLTFQPANNARLTEVLFTPGGRFGNVTAEWQVP
jgi:hypothetical protein